ncbi:MAG: acyltransferase [Bacteroidia bacterium]
MSFLTKIILKLISIERLRDELDNFQSHECRAMVSIADNSRFYPSSSVFNFLNSKTKITIGESTHIRGELLVFASGGSISIGKECYIGEGTRIWSAEKVEIGNHVLISHNCNIIDTDSHELNYLERADGYRNLLQYGHPKENKGVNTKPIRIEDYAWLSYNVSILKGVTIGKGAIIAAGSVVTNDVAPFTIVAGNPARIVKSIEPEK